MLAALRDNHEATAQARVIASTGADVAAATEIGKLVAERANRPWRERGTADLASVFARVAGDGGLGVSGADVVAAAHAAGARVSPVPGPSALAAALSVAGMHTKVFIK